MAPTRYSEWISDKAQQDRFAQRIKRDVEQYWSTFRKPFPMKLIATRLGKTYRTFDVFDWFVTVQADLDLTTQMANTAGRYIFPVPVWNSLDDLEKKRFARMGVRYEYRDVVEQPTGVKDKTVPVPTARPEPVKEPTKFF